MRRQVATLTLLSGLVLLIASPVAATPAHDGDDGEVLGHLFAGTSNPGVVYEYVGGTDWKAISPVSRAASRSPSGPQPYGDRRPNEDVHTAIGRAVLDLRHYEGHLYAGTVSEKGVGQVWRRDSGIIWTLVGDNLDDQVTSLETYQGQLYATTGVCQDRVYVYEPGSRPAPTADWRRQSDHRGPVSPGSTGPDQPPADVGCVRDGAERGAEAYLVADHAILRSDPDTGAWRSLWTVQHETVLALETLGYLVYTGYQEGQLRVSAADDWPGEIVFTTPRAIASLTTDGQALYVGTGGGLGRGILGGRVYRLDPAAGRPEPISGEFGASVEALVAVAPSGLDLSRLERGDILLARGPGTINGVIGFVATYLGGSYWIHGGMYAGEATVIESSSEVAEDFGVVRTVAVSETLFWQEGNYWAAIRVKDTDAREGATSYAEAQEGDLYNIDYPFWGLPVKRICRLLGPIIGINPAVCCDHPVEDRATEDDCFYCTQLPWRAYHRNGIDLDADAAWPARLFSTQALPGDDLYYDEDVTLVDQRKGMRAVVVSAVGSPAEMLVVDPQGRRTGVDPDTGEILDEIPRVTYGRLALPPILDFFLPDEWSSDYVAIPNLDRTWQIRIAGVQRGDYLLGAELVDWHHHRTQTMTRTTETGQVDIFSITFPDEPGAPIIRVPEVYLPLIVRSR